MTRRNNEPSGKTLTIAASGFNPKDVMRDEHIIYLLGVIGTEKSLQKLEQARHDFHQGEQVEQAIEKIKKRMGK